MDRMPVQKHRRLEEPDPPKSKKAEQTCAALADAEATAHLRLNQEN
jgi:hypothetical protein